jgi:hypothetical protein
VKASGLLVLGFVCQVKDLDDQALVRGKEGKRCETGKRAEREGEKERRREEERGGEKRREIRER